MSENEKLLVFIVDDDPIFTKSLENYLAENIPFLHIRTFGTGEAGLHEMYLNPQILILDYYLNAQVPNAWNGIQVLKKVKWSYPDTEILLVSAQQDIQTVLDGIQNGALGYIVKNDKVFTKVKNAILEISEDYL